MTGVGAANSELATLKPASVKLFMELAALIIDVESS
jgi:hypothetical protein